MNGILNGMKGKCSIGTWRNGEALSLSAIDTSKLETRFELETAVVIAVLMSIELSEQQFYTLVEII